MATILVVEDEPNMLSIFRIWLEQAGYTVLEAENGTTALQILQEHPVDAVVADVVMAHMGGRELMWRMSRSFPAVPVILVSGMLGPDHIEPEEVQPAGYLHKPVTRDQLVNAVEAVLK